MDALLLVLVLAAGDAASQSAAAAVAAALRAEPALTVVGAPASHAALAERGLSDRDLVQRSERVRDVTLADPRLAIVRVERREAGADGIIDIEIWARGQRVPVIVAGGAARDPLLSAPADAVRALRRAAPSAAEAQARQEEIIIDDCLARQDWEGLVHAASSAAAGPRLRYAAVVALLRLGDADGARAAAAALQERFPGHPLALAAQEVLAAAQPPANGAP